MDTEKQSQLETELKDLFEKHGLRIRTFEFPQNAPGKMGWGSPPSEPTPLKMKIFYDEVI